MDMDGFFSVVIPTMWRSDKISDLLKKYQSSKLVKEIIIIDNDPSQKIDLRKYKKVKYYTEGKNIFVNPAWNIGNLLSSHNLILSNDDIIIDNVDEVLNLIKTSDFDIVGVRLGEKTDNFRINEIRMFPKNHYGSFMYIKNYFHVPNTIKIWFGDDLQFDNNQKKGVLVNAGINSNDSQTVNLINNAVINEVYLRDKELYHEIKPTIFKPTDFETKPKVLSVLVNYGDEQIEYLERVTKELKSFEKYDVTVIVNSNIPLDDPSIDVVNVFDNLDDYQLLPITCRKTIWENKDNYDIFIFGENDHLFLEHHVDRYLEYCQILPEDRIAGLIQYEENKNGKFYPAYHKHYDWDYNSVEIHGGKLFAHFKNLHQATFILTKEQVLNIGEWFEDFYGPKTHYSVKCRVNTDIYGHSGLKKLICISDFKDNLIHHLPNLYINGDKGRNKGQRAEEDKMTNALIRLFNYDKKKVVCGIATVYERLESLKKVVESIIDQVDELYVYQNGYKGMFDFLKNDKITVISSVDTGIDMGDAGKFYTVDKHPDCYYLSIDDDILYPSDYVLSIVEGIKKYNNQCIVTHHGRSFDISAESYHANYIDSVHFRKKLQKPKEIHFPGTGVMGFYTDTFDIKFSDFKYRNIADLIVGVEASKRGVKKICLPHDSEWLVDTHTNAGGGNLFEINKTNKELNEYFLDNLHFIFGQTEPLVRNKTKNPLLNSINFDPNKNKVSNVDYDKVNQLLSKNNVKANPQPVKPIQNKPVDRRDIEKLRRDSLVSLAKKLQNVRPTTQNQSPHVFGGRSRQ